MPAMRRLLTMSAALMLAACEATPGNLGPSTPVAAELGPAPTNYQSAVRESVRTTFFDPYNIRDAELSQPILYKMVLIGQTDLGWIVCLRANAKNRMGGYTGRKVTGFVFFNGIISKSIDYAVPSPSPCETARYAPFKVGEAR